MKTIDVTRWLAGRLAANAIELTFGDIAEIANIMNDIEDLLEDIDERLGVEDD